MAKPFYIKTLVIPAEEEEVEVSESSDRSWIILRVGSSRALLSAEQFHELCRSEYCLTVHDPPKIEPVVDLQVEESDVSSLMEAALEDEPSEPAREPF